MSDPCEIVESLVMATSSCPALEVIVRPVSTGSGSSSAIVGFGPLLISSGVASSAVYPNAYTPITDSAVASSTLIYSASVLHQTYSRGEATSKLFVELVPPALVSEAQATGDSIGLDTPHLLVSAAAATSTVVINTVIQELLVNSARGTSKLLAGQDALASSEAASTSTLILSRVATAVVTSGAEGASVVFPQGVPQTLILANSAQAVSFTYNSVASSALVESSAEAASEVWYRDSTRVAWLMNTESTAASWYNNFHFESIAQPPGYVLAVGPDGIYELTGGTDDGVAIEAEVVGGFLDFGSEQIKRVDNMYFGYTSQGQVSVTAETYDSGNSPTTYYLEQRDAGAPRNSRVTLGKGLWGRYWRMTIRNVAGADFEIHDTTADIAVSPRRI